VGKRLLRELEGLFDPRRGRYRILYSIEGDANRVEILRIDHRSDVYRSDCRSATGRPRF
jgi:mRNA-degrading endonuclease RelE of RelBE toxin-antitoxin system